MSKKYFLSFHTIFIIDENIRWIEEFLIYYIHLGFDHFYLYDNDKSTGGDGRRTQNKYGFSITTETGNETVKLWDTIMKKYESYITYVKWAPLNEKGEVVYAQCDGVRHFINTYGHETEWIAMLDLDELLFSPTNKDIKEYLHQVPTSVSCVKVSQKKFKDRFLTNTLITQTYECVNRQFGFDWAPKNIFRCSDYKEINNIHFLYFLHDTVEIDPSIFRFNHYNVNDKQIAWMNTVYQPGANFYLDGVDNGMQRYAFLFDKLLRNDNDTFKSTIINTNTFLQNIDINGVIGTVLLISAISAWSVWKRLQNIPRYFKRAKK